jgi:putative (di)nucleoside polyphosphate hydrolase
MAKTPSLPLPYRRGVGLMLFNRQGCVLVARRVETPGDAWQMPQGGIDHGETPRQAAMRELEEEIGTAKAEIIAETPDWLTYELPADLIGKVWKGRYRGQTQKWFALMFTGEDGDIDIATKHPEFSEWRWARFDQLVDLIVPFKRDLYQAVTAEFAPIARKLEAAASKNP